MNYITQIVERQKKKRVLEDTLDMCLFFQKNMKKYKRYIMILQQNLDYSISNNENATNEVNNELLSVSKPNKKSSEEIKNIEEKNYNIKKSYHNIYYPFFLKEQENNKKKSIIMRLLELIMRKKIKCKRFYDVKSRTVDIKGLQAGVPQGFNFGMGSFTVDTQHYKASEKLQALDIMQYNLCNAINGINDTQLRDKKLSEVIDVQTQMLNIILNLETKKEEMK